MSDIGWAVCKLQAGCRVQRARWNDKGMYLELMHPSLYNFMFMTGSCIFMKTADDQRVRWLCPQADILATDWQEFKG